MSRTDVVHLSPVRFLAGCAAAAVLILLAGARVPVPPAVLAGEILVTVLLLFLLGSFRYRLDKTALTCGAALVVTASFWTAWWPGSSLKTEIAADGGAAIRFIAHHFFSFDGLENLIHIDTMLFILGLTFFVAAVAQTRLLETITFSVLRKTRGNLLATVALITALVSFSSGILDGVSMIGLMIRVLTILLLLARAPEEERIFFVLVATMITTICGMWLAYGEPPNLIMKANLEPRLTDGFFLRWCLPVAVASYGVLFLHMRRRLGTRRVDLADANALEIYSADAKFRQGLGPDAAEMETEAVRRLRIRAQRLGGLAFVPFVALLVAHAVNHHIPLFYASFAGATAAFAGIWRHRSMRRLAARDARHEFAEYLFLLPLFFSISLLTRTGFFDALSDSLRAGVDSVGPAGVALAQFTGATFLSAILDNNVVADFGSRALAGLPDAMLHLFAMAQIAGYALGGCWTHIGSAQSVVAFSFIRKDIRASFTPLEWMRMITPVIVQIGLVAAAIILVESALLSRLD